MNLSGDWEAAKLRIQILKGVRITRPQSLYVDLKPSKLNQVINSNLKYSDNHNSILIINQLTTIMWSNQLAETNGSMSLKLDLRINNLPLNVASILMKSSEVMV